MVMVNGQYRLLHLFAINEQTGEKVVPSATALLNGDERFYDPSRDKGNLVCSGCEVAHLIERKGHGQAGNKGYVRDHFALAHGEVHALGCEIEELGLIYPEGPHTRSEALAPYFYWNTEKPPTVYDAKRPKMRAWINPSAQNRLPEWVKKISYGISSKGFQEIISPADFVRRPRMDPAKTAADMIKILTTLSMEKKEDAWVIVNGVAVKFNDTILIERDTSQPRDLSLAQQIKDHVNKLYRERYGKGNDVEFLPRNLMMAEDSKYDHFAAQFYTQRIGVQFPALLHIQINEKPKWVNDNGAQHMVIDLGEYRTENKNPQGVDLPVRTIERLVKVTDRDLFDRLQPGTELFAATHPTILHNDRTNWRFTQYFNVLSATFQTKQEVEDRMTAVDTARERLEAKRAARLAAPSEASPT